MVILKIIRDILARIVDDIDNGRCELSTSDANDIFNIIKAYDGKYKMSKYSACKYLGVSRATFDLYVNQGKIPKGVHEIGFKELSWCKSDLDKFIKECNDNCQ